MCKKNVLHDARLKLFMIFLHYNNYHVRPINVFSVKGEGVQDCGSVIGFQV